MVGPASSNSSRGARTFAFPSPRAPFRFFACIGTMNRSESPSTALRAPSPPLGEKDGMRRYGSWKANSLPNEVRQAAVKAGDSEVEHRVVRDQEMNFLF